MTQGKWNTPKDPDEVLDFTVDWNARLEGDTVYAYEVAVMSGSVVVQSSSMDEGIIRIWFAGGTDGETCEILTRVSTNGGRTMDRTTRLLIRSK